MGTGFPIEGMRRIKTPERIAILLDRDALQGPVRLHERRACAAGSREHGARPEVVKAVMSRSICTGCALAYPGAQRKASERGGKMAAVTFTPPRQWEDWASWLLGFWLLLSPWIVHFANDTAATQNAVIIGFALILAEVVTLSAFQVWEEWVNVALGAWLLVSPWVLRDVGVAAGADFVAVGLLVIALAVYEMWQVRDAHKGGP